MLDFVAIGSIIIDDIVDPQGHTTMGVLGGGGSHAVAGMRVWSEKTALVSVIGQAFPETAWQHLQSLADTGGISQRAVPQPRAWQLFEADGTRNEVFRTDFETFLSITVQPHEYPPAFASARGVYLQTGTTREAAAWAAYLRNLNATMTLLWEPWQILYQPENLADFSRVAPLFDIISPNTTEICEMIAETRPEQQAQILFECGVRCLALRLGAAGSLAGTSAQLHYIPAAPALVVDETGAGNSYCGGFVVGYVESGGEALTAGYYGAVSATFTLAQLGLARLGPDATLVAQERLREIENNR